MRGTIYLLHFSQPYKHAKHYIGFARDLSARLESHANGTGARLMEVITTAGIGFELARTWAGSRKTERQPRKKNKTAKKPSPYILPKTAAELGIVCTGGNSGDLCGLPVVWFDYELGEKNHRSGFVCDEHKVSKRVERLAQPQAKPATVQI